MIGTTLSHFRIISQLGVGGMGEVYLAEDTKLGREVAIKVLPETFVADPERLARFEREAKVLAALSHPNIAGIYEVGTVEIVEDEGAPHPRAQRPVPTTDPGAEGRRGVVHYLVMELAAGETLAERIGRGPLAVEDAVAIALQVSRALEEAHERGIVHRDLKPGNVMVDAKQQVKVLDFGLAKALDPAPGTESRSQLDRSPTLSYQATLAGTLLGTAAYMSPEQARGQPADRRSDVWSFGVVLWEMLTGRRLFEGGSVSDTLAGILRDEIHLQELPASCPPALARVLRRCLERDPDRRLHDIADVRIVLQDLADGVEEIEVDGRVGEREGAGAKARRGPLAIWLAATAAVAIVAGLIGYQLRPASEIGPGPRRFSIQLGPGQHLSPANSSGIAFHPDGKSLVFTGVVAGQPVLCTALSSTRPYGRSRARRKHRVHSSPPTVDGSASRRGAS